MNLSLLHALVPSGEQIVGILAMAVVALAFSVIGAAVGGRSRLAGADMVVGWGIALLTLVVPAVVFGAPLTVGALLLLGVLGVAAWHVWRERIWPPRVLLLIVLISLPLWAVIASMAPSQWDEFSHWLLAARYLVENNAFPGMTPQPSTADFPGYPYGVGLPVYLASKLAGGFIETGGAAFNVFLLMSFALVVVELIRESGASTKPAGCGLAAIGFLAVTVFNPTFIQKIILTAYADFPTTAACGVAGVLAYRTLNQLAAGEAAFARRSALGLAFALTALIHAKQSNLILVLLIIATAGLVAWRDPSIRFKVALPHLALALVPAAFLHIVWQHHVAVALAGGQMEMRPFASWDFSTLPGIMATMLGIMLRKGVYFVLGLFAIGWAIHALWRCRAPHDRLALITGGTVAGFNAFLLFTYLAVFSGYTATHALSYWRYNTHNGLLLVAFAAVFVAAVWQRHGARRWPNVPAWPAVVIAILLPVVFMPKLRFDIHPVKMYVNDIAPQIRALLPRDARLGVVDAVGTGLYSKIMRYRLRDWATVHSAMTVFSRYEPGQLASALENGKFTHVWVHTATGEVARALGVDALPQAASQLLQRRPVGWELLASWPYPGYANPADMPE